MRLRILVLALLTYLSLVPLQAQFGLLGRGVSQGTPTNQTGAVTDSDLFFSPYVWHGNGVGTLGSNNVTTGSTQATTTNPGAYLQTIFNCTSATLGVNVSSLSGAGTTALDYPAISWSIDGGGRTRQQLTSGQTTVTLATGLANTTHTLIVDFEGIGITEDRWNTPVQALTVTGLTLDGGCFLSAPSIRAKRILAVGDSVTECIECLASGVNVANQQGRSTYARLLGSSCLNAEVGVLGYSFQGFTTVGSGNVPVLPSSWDHYWSGASRLVAGNLSPPPDYIVSGMGINDGATNTISTISTLIGSWRSAASTAKIVMVVPWNGTQAANIASGVTASGDGNAFTVNTGVTRYNTFGSPHISVLGHSQWEGDQCPLFP